MKILHINSLYHPHVGGGAEIALRTLVEGLSKRNHENIVLATGPEPGLHEDEIAGIRIVRAGLKNVYWHFRQPEQPPPWKRALWHMHDIHNRFMARIASEVIRREHPDVVSCNNLAGWSAAVWDAVKNAETPLVQVIHDLYLLCPTSMMFCRGKACNRQCFLCKMFRFGHPRKSDKVDGVVGVSQFVLNRLVAQGYFTHANIKEIIPNACTLTSKSGKQTLTTSRNRSFGFIGTLAPAKGIEMLLETFTQLALPEAQLLIAGTGREDYAANLKQRYAGDNIRFLGYQRPEEFFSTIDVLVVPSLCHEAMGMIIPEANACGIPVIGSRRGGIPEIITEGSNGFLFDPEVPRELAILLQRLAEKSNDLKDMNCGIASSAAKFLDVENWLNSYEQLFYLARNNHRVSH